MAVPARVLVVSGSDAPSQSLDAGLVRHGFEPVYESDVPRACARLRADRFAAVVAELDGPGTEALALLRAARRQGERIPTLLRLGSHRGSPAVLATVRQSPDTYLLGADDDSLVEQLLRTVGEDPSQQAPDGEPGTLQTPEAIALAPLRAAVSVSSPAELDGARELVAAAARDATGADAVWLVAWDQTGESVTHSGAAAPAPHSIAREVRLAARSLALPPSLRGAAHAGVPVTFEGKVVAALLARYARAEDASVSLPLLEDFALHAEAAETGARLWARLNESSESLVVALSNVLALAGIDAAGHAARVTNTATKLAVAYGHRHSTEALRDLRLAASLHDIGKIGVPEAVLRKTGALDDTEWLALRHHPEHAMRILGDLPELAEAGRLILASREHWDGSGYPNGLAGVDIPAGARILAVADVWDELRSDHLFHPRLSVESALSEVERQAGTRFDPGVVRALVRVARAETVADGVAMPEAA
jgi:hypothetical protein